MEPWGPSSKTKERARPASPHKAPRSPDPKAHQESLMAFTPYGFSAELLRGIRELGFKVPTPIQEQALPPAIIGRDVLACAMTGSGKTAAFGLPILHRLGRAQGAVRALILTPTRELAAQIDEHLNALAVHTTLSSAAIFGGVGMGPQEHALRRGTDIIVATPGRLIDHLNRPYADFRKLEVLVLDEADRMLDMGFLPDIRRILKHVPERRQTLFFSATMPPEIAKLAKEMVKDPFTIAIERQSAPATGITQAAYPVAHHLKPVLLAELMKRGLIGNAIVFTRTKARANRLADFLTRLGIAAGRIHGDRTQAQRTETLKRFKSGKFNLLVATDIAARGIDVEALSHVVNFDVPKAPEDYIHRVGRTGRNEALGDAFAFFSPDEEGALRAIERAIGARLPRVTLPDFDYNAAPKAPPAPPRFRQTNESDDRRRKPFVKTQLERAAATGDQGRDRRSQGRNAQDQGRARDNGGSSRGIGSGIRRDASQGSSGAARPPRPGSFGQGGRGGGFAGRGSNRSSRFGRGGSR